MMKKTLSKFQWACLALIVIVVPCVQSCRKDQQIDKLVINRLQEFYQTKMLSNSVNEMVKLAPQWDKVVSNSVDGKNVYEITLSNPHALAIIFDQSEIKDVAFRSDLRLLLFEDVNSSKIQYASYMYIQSNKIAKLDDLHYKNFGKLNGKVIYFHQSGQMANGWVLSNGKPIEQTSAVSGSSYEAIRKSKAKSGGNGKLMNGGDEVCAYVSAPSYFYGCVGASGPGGGHTDCGWQPKGNSTVLLCKTVPTMGGEQTTTDWILPDLSSGYYPPNFDCWGVENGTAIWTDECGCIGGTTGRSDCLKDIDVKTDSLSLVSN